MQQSKETSQRVIAAIVLAADDVSKLRRSDVFRVLSDLAQEDLLLEGALFLSEFREELAEEVASCVEKLIKS